jgi:hypothetical protein
MDDKPVGTASAKKVYQAPRLIVYGDIRRLTLNLARNSVRDGGSNSQRT